MRLALYLIAGLAFALPAAARDAHPMFRWPVLGKIDKSPNGGVDIRAPEGAAVHAAADGTVIYASDELKSFGRMIVVRHEDGYVTAYAYLSELGVQKDATVKRGQVIGKVGKTGGAPAPELHFELRDGEENLDPIGYMTTR